MTLRPALLSGLSALVLLLPGTAAAIGTTLSIELRAEMSGTNLGGAQFQRGAEGVLAVRFRNCQPGQSCPFYERTTVHVQLPPGLVYDRADSYAPAWVQCAAAAPDAAGQRVSCTGAGLSGNGNALNASSGVDLWLLAAPDAPLGPATFTAAIDDRLPDDTATLVACLADPAPAWCDRLTGAIVVPPVPALAFTGSGHAPARITVGADGELHASFGNGGGAASAGLAVHVQLPVGLEWRPQHSVLWPAPAACSAQGSSATGLQVSCVRNGGLAAGSNDGLVRIGVVAGLATATPGPLDVLFALDGGAVPDAAGRLLACAADPTRPDCRLHAVPTDYPCALQHADGIYCDGWEGPIVRP